MNAREWNERIDIELLREALECANKVVEALDRVEQTWEPEDGFDADLHAIAAQKLIRKRLMKMERAAYRQEFNRLHPREGMHIA